MHDGADGNKLQRQRIARLNVDIVVAGDHRGADLQAFGRKNITPLTVSVTKQRNPRRAVGIVFDRLHFRRHVEFIALEIDHPIKPLVAAAPMIRGDPTGVVTSAAVVKALAQTLFRFRLGHLIESEARCENAFRPRWVDTF